MNRSRIFCSFALVVFVGCSNTAPQSAGPNAEDSVREVVEMIRLYSGQAKRGPSKSADLYKYELGFPLGIDALKSGEVVIVPGATVGEGSSEEVVAYEKKVPTEGGCVGLQNGRVKQMTAAEFNTAPKAGKK